MRLFSALFGRPRRKAPANAWARFALDQLLSERWREVVKQFYEESREHVSRAGVSEESFVAEVLGAQLQLLALVSVHTNRNLGMEVIVLIQDYLDKLPTSSRPAVQDAYGYCNRKVGEHGVSGMSGYTAVTQACAERLGLRASSDFVKRLEVAFTALGETWRRDAAQYRFVPSPEDPDDRRNDDAKRG